jgi:hypothetical protein
MRQTLKFKARAAPEKQDLAWIACSDKEVAGMWELTESEIECERLRKVRGKDRPKNILLFHVCESGDYAGAATGWVWPRSIYPACCPWCGGMSMVYPWRRPGARLRQRIYAQDVCFLGIRKIGSAPKAKAKILQFEKPAEWTPPEVELPIERGPFAPTG